MNFDLSALNQLISSLGRPNPARDWTIVASTGIVVAALGVVLAGYLFWGTQTGSIVTASADVPRPPIPVSRDAIKTVLEIYQQRAANYAARNFISVTLTDPRPLKR